ncbi:MAG: ADP-heptose synthase [Pirellulaceae bacterium]|nr:MAG: ADP-heptose synthase [Pirellulaceae bacterium]
MELTSDRLELILNSLPQLTIGLLGDLFLDRYLDIDPAMEERSIETGRPAHQVVRIRNSAGALGTVLNNLAALGVGKIVPVTVIGEDGHGYDLLRALTGLPVDTGRILQLPDRMTPTYIKPLETHPDKPPVELNRLDVRNRDPLSREAQALLAAHLQEAYPECDGWIVLDQVPEADAGVVNAATRELLGELVRQHAEKPVLVDSRERLGLFYAGIAKGNRREFLKGSEEGDSTDYRRLTEAVHDRVRQTGQPAFCTLGEHGILAVSADGQSFHASAVPVEGPIDIVGAGDAASSAILCALLAGASIWEAAAFANLVASITIEQLGTTGVARPEDVRRRFAEKGSPHVKTGELMS